MRSIVILLVSLGLFTGVAIAQEPAQSQPTKVILNDEQLTEAVVGNFQAVQKLARVVDQLWFTLNFVANDEDFAQSQELKASMERAGAAWQARMEEMQAKIVEEQSKDKRIAELEAKLAEAEAKNGKKKKD